jgi:hypothetical protein
MHGTGRLSLSKNEHPPPLKCWITGGRKGMPHFMLSTVTNFISQMQANWQSAVILIKYSSVGHWECSRYAAHISCLNRVLCGEATIGRPKTKAGHNFFIGAIPLCRSITKMIVQSKHNIFNNMKFAAHATYHYIA